MQEEEWPDGDTRVARKNSEPTAKADSERDLEKTKLARMTCLRNFAEDIEFKNIDTRREVKNTSKTKTKTNRRDKKIKGGFTKTNGKNLNEKSQPKDIGTRR